MTVNGTAGNDSLAYTPTGATAGNVVLAGKPQVNFTGVGSTFTLDPLGGIDTVTVNGNAASNLITLTGVLGAPTLQLDGLKSVTLPASSTEALVISGGLGNDTLTVNAHAAPVLIPVSYDGGVGGVDELMLTGGVESTDIYTSGSQPGAGNSTIVFTSGGGGTQSVDFQNLEPVTDRVIGPLSVGGTSGADDIEYGQGPTANDGEVAVNGSEPIIFSNKTTLALDGGFGSDSFTIDNANTPTGLTAITVTGGSGTDSLHINAHNNAVNVSTPGTVNIGGPVPIGYSSIESITITNALDSILGIPLSINALEGQAFSNIGVGTFTGGPFGAVASDFTATINWGDGTTSAGAVTGSAGSFAIAGTHTFAEEGGYTVTVTVTDPNTTGSAVVGGVPITINYVAAATGSLSENATILDQQLTNFVGTPTCRRPGRWVFPSVPSPASPPSPIRPVRNPTALRRTRPRSPGVTPPSAPAPSSPWAVAISGSMRRVTRLPPSTPSLSW